MGNTNRGSRSSLSTSDSESTQKHSTVERLTTLFHKYDTDGNGNLSRQEFQKFAQYVLEHKSEFHFDFHQFETNPDESFEHICDVLFDICDLDGNGTISFAEFQSFMMTVNLKVKKDEIVASLPLELPRNCIYFIWALKTVTARLFAKDGISFPLDTVMYIVTFNAIIGEFKAIGLCSNCHQWHHSDKPNNYHKGTWHGMTYEEFLNKKFSIDLARMRFGDTGHFWKKSLEHAGKNAVKDTVKGSKLAMKHGGRQFMNHRLLSFLAKGGALGIGLFTLYQVSMVPYALGTTMVVGGVVGSAVVGGTHALATPVIEGSKVIASNLNPHYHPRTHTLERWTCCYEEGSWATPCQSCAHYCSDSTKNSKSHLEIHHISASESI